MSNTVSILNAATSQDFSIGKGKVDSNGVYSTYQRYRITKRGVQDYNWCIYKVASSDTLKEILYLSLDPRNGLACSVPPQAKGTTQTNIDDLLRAIEMVAYNQLPTEIHYLKIDKTQIKIDAKTGHSFLVSEDWTSAYLDVEKLCKIPAYVREQFTILMISHFKTIIKFPNPETTATKPKTPKTTATKPETPETTATKPETNGHGKVDEKTLVPA
jgi:hypothetical protein